MSKSKTTSLVQKKKRLAQLRDAQRRRRERLRDDKQHFVQIILPEATLAELNRLISGTGETMQQAIARLVQSALPDDLASLPVLPVETTHGYEEVVEISVPRTIEEIVHKPTVFESAAVENPVETGEKMEEVPLESEPIKNKEQISEVEPLPKEWTDAAELEEPTPEGTIPETEESTQLDMEMAPSNKNSGQLDLFG